MVDIPPKADRPTVEQRRVGLARLERCIQELEAFDPQKVQKRKDVPEVVALEATIDGALAAAFGHGSPSYDRYRHAATLDTGSRSTRISPTWGREAQINYEAREAEAARRYLTDGKQRSIGLLYSAIRTVKDDISDLEILAKRLDPARGAPEKGVPSRSEVLSLKPGIWGVSIDLNELWRRGRARWGRRK